MKKLILDLDTGIDDTLAIAYAIGSPEVELIGVTGTYGNVTVEEGMSNSLAVLDLFGHPEIPVYPGVSHPTESPSFVRPAVSSIIHGHNGLGDAKIPKSVRKPQSVSAVDFIIHAAEQYGKDLLFVPTGALSTVAQVFRQAPQLNEAFGTVTLMGGALTVPGNVSQGAEANIAQDPQAANYLFRSGARTTMVGLDVTHQCVLTRKETALWRNLGTDAGRFLADMTDFYIAAYERTQPALGGCGLHDPLAVAAAIDPTLITTLAINLQVDTEGAYRGRTVGDSSRLSQTTKTTQVAVGVDALRFKQEFMRRVTSVASRQ